jgi:hypothetical protein
VKLRKGRTAFMVRSGGPRASPRRQIFRCERKPGSANIGRCGSSLKVERMVTSLVLLKTDLPYIYRRNREGRKGQPCRLLASWLSSPTVIRW